MKMNDRYGERNARHIYTYAYTTHIKCRVYLYKLCIQVYVVFGKVLRSCCAAFCYEQKNTHTHKHNRIQPTATARARTTTTAPSCCECEQRMKKRGHTMVHDSEFLINFWFVRRFCSIQVLCCRHLWFSIIRISTHRSSLSHTHTHKPTRTLHSHTHTHTHTHIYSDLWLIYTDFMNV